MPVASTNWIRHDYNSVIYTCDSLQLRVTEIHIDDVWYAVGCLLPIVPCFLPEIPLGKVEPNIVITIYLKVEPLDFELSQSDLLLQFQGGNIIPYKFIKIPSAARKAGVYEYYFDKRRKDANEFELVFVRALPSCAPPPLTFQLKNEIKYDVGIPPGV